MRPRVLVASPVRNRAWILPEFLAALERLDCAPEDVSYYFLANDCADDSAALLRAWAGRRPRADVEEVRTGVPGWHRSRWPRYDFVNLARLRNRILDRLLGSDATHLFSVDSDVIVPPHALRALLGADRPVVAGVISNLPGLSIRASAAHNFQFRRDGRYRHERRVPRGLFQVDLTGAVVLVRRDVVEAGVRYRAGSSGEDRGFCERARAKGFTLWCHGDVRCEHRMVEPDGSTPQARTPAVGSAGTDAVALRREDQPPRHAGPDEGP